MEILLVAGVFIFTILVIQTIYFVFRTVRDPEKKAVKRRLRSLSPTVEDENVNIVRKKVLSQIPWFNRLLLRFRWTERANRLLEQADAKYPLGVYILFSVVLFLIGLLGSGRFSSFYLIRVFVGAILAAIPFWGLRLKKKKRMEKFQKQLPDALDLVARGLKAGHALTGGLKLVAEEMVDPIGTEFDRTLDEINFGVGVPEALKGLSNRVDCPDLKFFVISVIIQRETGGNLAEILEKIAYLIRERFKLFGRVRVLTAQGRLSALVLIVLPFVVAFGMSFLNPRYIHILSTDPLGKILVIFALILMIFGALVMRRMVAIKV